MSLSARPEEYHPDRRHERRFVDGYVDNYVLKRQEDGSEKLEYCYPAPRTCGVSFIDVSILAIREEYERCRIIWTESECGQVLRKLFRDMLLETPTLRISEVVSLGIGSFTTFRSPDISEKLSGPNPFYQLLVLESAVELLQQTNDITNKNIYFQDPDFRNVDREFLASKDFTVVEDPEACNIMTPTTFLYAPGVPWFIHIHAFGMACPALYMGTHYDLFFTIQTDSTYGCDKPTKEDVALVEHFIRTRSTMELPNPILYRDQYIVLSDVLSWKPGPGKKVTKTVHEDPRCTWHAKGIPVEDSSSDGDSFHTAREHFPSNPASRSPSPSLDIKKL